jgi:integrase
MISDEFDNTIWHFYETNLSKRTRTEYSNVIKGFVKLTGTDPCRLTKESADAYSSMLVERISAGRLSYNTALMRISVMRSICEYIRYQKSRQGRAYYNYFNDIIMPDEDKTIKKEQLPSEKEIDALLLLARENNDNKAFLLFALVIKCALTSSELSSMNVEHIVLDSKERLCIQFPVKNKTSRIIRLPDDIGSLLNEYIDNNHIFEGPVFLNSRRTRLKVRDAQRILNRYIEDGIKQKKIFRHFTFQDMRHAAFGYMLKGGATEAEVAEYGGITTKWLPRYRQLIHSEDGTDTADYSIIQIKAKN